MKATDQCDQHRRDDCARRAADWAEGTKQAKRNAREWQRRARQAYGEGHTALACNLWAQASVEMRGRKYDGKL